MKVADLTGVALDWAVAQAEGMKTEILCGQVYHKTYFSYRYSPSTSWAQGGPIIGRERIGLGSYADLGQAVIHLVNNSLAYNGETLLIAAMRCYVASVLGEDVDIPEEIAR